MGQAEYQEAMSNASFTYDITQQHVQVTTDMMVRLGVGRLRRAPKATEWVRLDLLANAKKKAGLVR